MASKALYQLLEANQRLLARAVEHGLDDDSRDRRDVRLKPREQEIVNLLGHRRMLGRQIAAALNLEFVSSFQQTLGLLVRFGVLTNDRDGYAVARCCQYLIGTEDSGAWDDEQVDDDAPEKRQSNDANGRTKTPRNQREND